MNAVSIPCGLLGVAASLLIAKLRKCEERITELEQKLATKQATEGQDDR